MEMFTFQDLILLATFLITLRIQLAGFAYCRWNKQANTIESCYANFLLS